MFEFKKPSVPAGTNGHLSMNYDMTSGRTNYPNPLRPLGPADYCRQPSTSKILIETSFLYIAKT